MMRIADLGEDQPLVLVPSEILPSLSLTKETINLIGL